MSNKSPKESVCLTVEDLRKAAYEALKQRKETGDEELGVGLDPEIVFMLANCLEDCGVEAIGVFENEDQLEFVGFDDDTDESGEFN